MKDYAENKGIDIPPYPSKMPEWDRREISSLDEALIRLYSDEIFTEENQHICEECRKSYRAERSRELHERAIGHWFIGREFDNSCMKGNGEKARILFVGKNAVGNDFEKDDIEASFFCPCYGSSKWLWEKYPSAYWTFTKAIVYEVFGDDSMEHVGFTNLLKCNGGGDKDYRDDATSEMKEFCIEKLAVMRREIELIQPTHMIFYTGWDYDDHIKKLFAEPAPDLDKWEKKKIGKRNRPWCEATVRLEGSDREIKMLRVCHPGAFVKKYSDGDQVGFVNAVSEWILGDE